MLRLLGGMLPSATEGPWAIVGAIAALVAAIGVIMSGVRVTWRRHRLKLSRSFARVLISGLSYKTTFNRELLISSFPLYLI